MSMIEPADAALWQRSIGRQLIQIQWLTKQGLRRYALAIGLTGEEANPPLQHWAHFLPAPADAHLGEDGYPQRGGFLPAVALTHRMLAGATIDFEGPLETGDEATLATSIVDVTHKQGRSGKLTFVAVDRVLTQDGTVRVRERQTYVYSANPGPTAMPGSLAEPPDGQRWEPGEVHLFRFSAATFNGHRIHYDRPYATEIEGYPSLVIQGRFTAAKLALLAAEDGDITGFSFRARTPLFLGQPVFLQRGETPGDYRAVRADGATAMTAKVSFR